MKEIEIKIKTDPYEILEAISKKDRIKLFADFISGGMNSQELDEFIASLTKLSIICIKQSIAKQENNGKIRN
jgi:hypothetical protein